MNDPNASEVWPIQLSREQYRTLDTVKEGKNVFFTGSAGSGKSVLLREIIRYLHSNAERQGWDDHSVAITATTGLAAVNIGGRTLHSWAGIGLGNGTVPQLLSKLRASHKKWKSGSIEDKKFARLASDTELFDELFVRDKVTTTAIERWRLTRVLIIDEGKT